MGLIITNIDPNYVFADALISICNCPSDDVPDIDAKLIKTSKKNYTWHITVFNKKNDNTEKIYLKALNVAKNCGFDNVILEIDEKEKDIIKKIIFRWFEENEVNAMNNPFTVQLSIFKGE